MLLQPAIRVITSQLYMSDSSIKHNDPVQWQDTTLFSDLIVHSEHPETCHPDIYSQCPFLKLLFCKMLMFLVLTGS